MKKDKKLKEFKLVVSSGKGGVGKSMLVSALAVLFSKKKKVVAVDCDVDAPNLAIWLNEDGNWQNKKKISTSAKAVIDYKKCVNCKLCVQKCRFKAIEIKNNKPVVNYFLCEGCAACQVICPQKAIRLKSVKNGEIKTKRTKYGFFLVSGQLFPGDIGSGKIITEIKKEASAFADSAFVAKATSAKEAASADKQAGNHIMIIDSAPGTGCPVIASLQGADFVVLITEPTPSGFSDLNRVLEVVNHFNIPYNIVINKWDINSDLSRKIEQKFKKEFLGRISYDKNIFKAISNLTPILETNLKAKEEIKKIYKKLVKNIN
ncbi:MAG: ATP-binding protein [Minisyncoccales bacterium]